MSKRSDEELSNAVAKAIANRVQKTLDVMRIQGWRFPRGADVGVRVLRGDALSTEIAVRMDDVRGTGTIRTASIREDVVAIVDDLVAAWLQKNATARPVRRRRESAHA